MYCLHDNNSYVLITLVKAINGNQVTEELIDISLQHACHHITLNLKPLNNSTISTVEHSNQLKT